MRPARVVILQESIEPYRLAFFLNLRSRLSESGVELLVYAYPDGIHPDLRDEPWIRPLQFFGRGRLRWAWMPKEVRKADLVIQPQQVRHLSFNMPCI